MAELRRLLIENFRLKANIGIDGVLPLNSHEKHYLKRVLRLRRGDAIAVLDGVGHLWEATLLGVDSIRLSSSLDCPLETQPRPKPLIGLAVVLPKRGFSEMLRMSCEIGVDIIQPLCSERSVVHIDKAKKSSRWEGILREAVEQSERLWIPEFRSIIHVSEWLKEKPSKASFAFASTRLPGSNDLQFWMMGIEQKIDQIYVAIGPEGGWTPKEQALAKELSCIDVQLGESIMRTSTAAVVATKLMVDWRRNSSLCI